MVKHVTVLVVLGVLLCGARYPEGVERKDDMGEARWLDLIRDRLVQGETVETTGPTGQAEPDEAAGPLEVSEVVARVQAFYDNIESYHADFEQTYTNVALAEDQVSTGHVYFLKPGRMRWDYLGPQEKYLISDGEVLWIYEPEFNQVARVELAATDLPSALRFLMGEGVLTDDFDITSCDSQVEGTLCMHLVSRTGEGEYQYLEFVVDDSEFHVVQTMVVDPIGNYNRFVFSNASTTDPLPVEGFQFTPPSDARIVTPH